MSGLATRRRRRARLLSIAATIAVGLTLVLVGRNVLGDVDRLDLIAVLAAAAAVLALGLFGGLRLSDRGDGPAPAENDASTGDLHGIFRHLPIAAAIVRPRGEIAVATPPLTMMLGRSIDHLDDLADIVLPHHGSDLRLILEPKSTDDTKLSLVHRALRPDGGATVMSVAARDLRTDPAVRGHLVIFTESDADETARDNATPMRRDDLTALPDRQSLEADLWRRDGHAIVVIDLDDFSTTNALHGHDVGDELLTAVAGRLVAVVDPRDRLYRIGADEYAVVMHDARGDLGDLVQQIQRVFADPCTVSIGSVAVSASVGATARSADDGPHALLTRSYDALAEAKRRGSGHAVIAGAPSDGSADRRHRIGQAFLQADFRRECHLEFQPIVHADGGSTSHFEALARWTSPEVGRVPPDQFIPIAEASGRIHELGAWVLHEAVSALADWRAAGVDRRVGVTVNVSPFQLDDDQFVPNARAVLERHGIEPEAVTFELTESALVTADDPVVAQLRALRSNGCGVACDDFGSGYSNLGQLMTLPLDTIKLDRSLLVRLVEERGDRDQPDAPFEMMQAWALMARSMRSTLVAEGIETEAQARAVAASGVGLLQGYHFSRPMRSGDVAEWLRGSAAHVEAFSR